MLCHVIPKGHRDFAKEDVFLDHHPLWILDQYLINQSTNHRSIIKKLHFAVYMTLTLHSSHLDFFNL